MLEPAISGRISRRRLPHPALCLCVIKRDVVRIHCLDSRTRRLLAANRPATDEDEARVSKLLDAGRLSSDEDSIGWEPPADTRRRPTLGLHVNGQDIRCGVVATLLTRIRPWAVKASKHVGRIVAKHRSRLCFPGHSLERLLIRVDEVVKGSPLAASVAVRCHHPEIAVTGGGITAAPGVFAIPLPEHVSLLVGPEVDEFAVWFVAVADCLDVDVAGCPGGVDWYGEGEVD